MSEQRVPYLLAAEAARLLGVTPTTIRWLVDTGRLRALRTASGVRLINKEDVEHMRDERETRKARP